VSNLAAAAMFEQIVIRSKVKKQELKEAIGEWFYGVPC
jgi:hypothetical protein